MNKLSLLFNMLKLPALLPVLPYLGIGVCLVGLAFGVNKVFKEKKYKQKVKEQKVTYAECIRNAMSYSEIQKCYLIQQKEAKE